MIVLNGLHGIKRIDTDTINYWYHLNDTLYIVGNFGDVVNIGFASAKDCIAARNELNKILYKYQASIFGSNGIVYNIQCKKLKSHSLSTATITCTFETLTLSIVCFSASNGTSQNNYLANIFYSSHLSKNILAKTKIYVSTTIQAAIDTAVSGNVVIVPKGYYYERVTLKDGVDLIFEKGSILAWGFNGETSNGLVFGNDYVVKIFGEGSFYFRGTGSFPHEYCHLGAGTIANIYFEFYHMESYSQIFGIGHEVGCLCYLKGYSFKADRNSQLSASSPIDSDGFGLIDFDVVQASLWNEFYYGYGLLNGIFTIRNCNIISSQCNSGIFNNYACFPGEDIEVIFAGVVAKSFLNATSQESLLFKNGDCDTSLRLFNCYGEAIGSGYTIMKDGAGLVNVTIYGTSYFNKNYGGGVSVSGTYTLDTTLAV